MNYLIVFDSYFGVNERVAKELRKRMGNIRCDLVNLNQELPNFEIYNTIIVGSTMQNGQIKPAIRRFCEEYKEILFRKNLGLYTCFSKKEKRIEDYQKVFSVELREYATQRALMSGATVYPKLNLFAKIFFKITCGVPSIVTYEDQSEIQRFATEIKLENDILLQK